MAIINGYFTFQITGPQCIAGIYLHDGMQNGPFPECARLKQGTGPHAFEGIYTTIWINDDNEGSKVAELEIKQTAPGTYSLWWRRDSKVIFQGNGKLIGGLLTGSYE